MDSSSEMAERDMEHRVWSRLPEELLMEVLSRLGTLNFLRLRSVSRKWAALVHDDNFVEALVSRPQDDTSLLLGYANHDEFAAYSPRSKTWHTLPTNLVLQVSNRRIIGSAGGFLLLESEGDRTLYVFNPLNKTERKLPPLELKPVTLGRSAWIVVNGGSYYVVAISYDPSGPTDPFSPSFIRFKEERLELYDPENDEWVTKLWLEDPEHGHGTNVLHNGNMQVVQDWGSGTCHNLGSMTVHSENLHISSYVNGGFYMISIPMRKNSSLVPEYTDPDLYVDGKLVMGPSEEVVFVWQGKLSMAGVFYGSPDGNEGSSYPIHNVTIWQLDEESDSWVVLWTLAEELMEDFKRLRWEEIEEFDCPEWKGIEVNGQYCVAKGWNTVMCDMETGLWWFVPPYPGTKDATPHDEVSYNGFMMERQLDFVR